MMRLCLGEDCSMTPNMTPKMNDTLAYRSGVIRLRGDLEGPPGSVTYRSEPHLRVHRLQAIRKSPEPTRDPRLRIGPESGSSALRLSSVERGRLERFTGVLPCHPVGDDRNGFTHQHQPHLLATLCGTSMRGVQHRSA